MLFEFEGKKISGVVTVLPENEYSFEEEAADPTDIKNRRLKKLIGFGKRRRVKADTTLSEMLTFGIKKMLDEGKISKEDIGAIVVSTLSEDYFLPQISCIIHGNLDLDFSVFCIDTPQACGGFAVGLIQSFMLLEHLGDKKVLLCTGEIFNRKTDPNEPKFSYPSYGGDIANITVVENSDSGDKIIATSYYDGKNCEALIVRDGCYKNPMTAEKIQIQTARAPHMGVEMDGSSVFNFVQREVPPAINELLEITNLSKDDIDLYLFHQPNKFMLQKLAEKMEVPFNKMPMDLTETMGNSDSGTIPAIMTTNVPDVLTEKTSKCCISGFGGGLNWTSMIMDVGPLEFCENIDSPF